MWKNIYESLYPCNLFNVLCIRSYPIRACTAKVRRTEFFFRKTEQGKLLKTSAPSPSLPPSSRLCGEYRASLVYCTYHAIFTCWIRLDPLVIIASHTLDGILSNAMRINAYWMILIRGHIEYFWDIWNLNTVYLWCTRVTCVLWSQLQPMSTSNIIHFLVSEYATQSPIKFMRECLGSIAMPTGLFMKFL